MTISIRLDDELEAELRKHVSEAELPLSEFVRQAIAEKLGREAAKPTAYELGKHLFGKFKSGRDDLSVSHEKLLKDRLGGRNRR
jgi:RHH-type rel operon transcriptional repressor/antitoxin RelB